MNNGRIRILFLALSDIISLCLVIMVIAWGYKQFGADYQISVYLKLWPILPFFLICNALIGLYHGNCFYPGTMTTPVEELRRSFYSVTFTFILLFSYLAMIRQNTEYSRLVLIVSWAVELGVMLVCRNLVRFVLYKLSLGQIKVLVAGYGKTGQALTSFLNSDYYYGYKVEGYLDDTRKDDVSLKYLGKLKEIVSIGKKKHVETLICCLPWHITQANLNKYMRYYKYLVIIPDNQVFPVAWVKPIDFSRIAGLEICNQLLLPGPRILKFFFEVVVSAIGMICLLPLFLVIALTIKLTSKGKIFYKSKRLGAGNKTIQVWKFRTMYQDADSRLEKILSENPEMEREWREKFKLTRDPRITPIGNFLRKTSLDELPQLINVILGEMSMIGPRPIVTAEKKYYGSQYKVFSRVKPGITGLWQVSGRSDTSYDDRVSLDIYYITNWSIWLDILILVKTVKEVLRCHGAR